MNVSVSALKLANVTDSTSLFIRFCFITLKLRCPVNAVLDLLNDKCAIYPLRSASLHASCVLNTVGDIPSPGSAVYGYSDITE
jgi:hypothetical protein